MTFQTKERAGRPYLPIQSDLGTKNLRFRDRTYVPFKEWIGVLKAYFRIK
jgi:hypothetical protein